MRFIMDNKANYNQKNINLKKKQTAIKSINNYLSQLKMHYELEDNELAEILKIVILPYKKISSIKKWWKFFK